MTDIHDLPAEAAEAATEAILLAPYPKVGPGTARNFAVAALRAAWPLIAAQAAAAEREACAQLAEQHNVTVHACLSSCSDRTHSVPFAGLIRARQP